MHGCGFFLEGWLGMSRGNGNVELWKCGFVEMWVQT